MIAVIVKVVQIHAEEGSELGFIGYSGETGTVAVSIRKADGEWPHGVAPKRVFTLDKDMAFFTFVVDDSVFKDDDEVEDFRVPLSVGDARDQSVCRICRKPISLRSKWTRQEDANSVTVQGEFAHNDCLARFYKHEDDTG